MTIRNISIIASILCLCLLSCRDDEIAPGPGSSNTGPQPQDNSWLIVEDEVFDGGPGKDGIPSVDNPQFVTNSEIGYMDSEDLVLAIDIDGDLRGYTHPILDWHEIVNDRVGGKDLAITYCPLTGTGSAWNREIDGQVTTFGVSGLLYRNNLIPYDRATDSHWSQIRLDCVQGTLKTREAQTYPLVELPWRTWKKMFPDGKVLSESTGFNRSYGRYPYGNYRNNEQLLFPVGKDDDRLPRKQRVLSVIIGGQSRVYTFDSFAGGIKVITDKFNGKELVVVGSQPDNFMIAYEMDNNLGALVFEPTDLKEGGIVMKDNTGSEWDIFGKAQSGPNAGKRLKKVDVCIGYWFSFGAFYNPQIF